MRYFYLSGIHRARLKDAGPVPFSFVGFSECCCWRSSITENLGALHDFFLELDSVVMASKVALPLHFRDWNNPSDPAVETPPKLSATQKPIYKRPWFIGVAIGIIVAIIIAIAVPLAVVLPKKSNGKHDASVMIPLYVKFLRSQ